MLNFYPIHNQQRNLQMWASRMRRNLLRIVPVSAIPPTNSTLKRQKNLLDTLSSTNTGHHSKWYQSASKSLQHGISLDKSCDIDLLAFKNFLNDMQILLKTYHSSLEKLEGKIPKIDKTLLNWNQRLAIQSYKMNGEINKSSSSLLPNQPIVGLSVKA